MVVNWAEIKKTYITTDISYSKLAAQYGVNKTTIANRARAEHWVNLRKDYTNKTLAKTVDKISSKKASKYARIDDLADQLVEKLEQAINELDMSIVVHKEKVENKDGSETTTEYREAKSGGIVDRSGLRQLTAALKDLKEIKDVRDKLDRQEQRARIRSIEAKVQADDSADSENFGVIMLPDIQPLQPPEECNE